MRGGVVYMLVDFMKNSSAEIVVNKTVSMSKSLDCQLKTGCSVQNPVFIVNGVNISEFNYMQVQDFGGRYYYVDEVITRNQGVIEVAGRVDVLMSFKADILKSQAVIERNQNVFSKYISDSKYTILNYERIQTKVFPNSFPNNGEFILVVAGG